MSEYDVTTGWRNRIARSGDAPLAEITANPKNWREHGALQSAALSTLLATVGVVQSVVIQASTGTLIDGHLRVALAEQHGESTVPAVWVDLDDAESDLILASLDPIGALAETNRDALASLLGELGGRQDALGEMLAGLAAAVTTAEVEPPSEFPSFGHAIEIEHRCPSCGYEWSGQPS
jgi:ParB-like chromosome segregation protein Spo0J